MQVSIPFPFIPSFYPFSFSHTHLFFFSQGCVDDLFPLILATLKDQSSVFARETALRALGQLVSNLGNVIDPYIRYPDLLPLLLYQIKTETNPVNREHVWNFFFFFFFFFLTSFDRFCVFLDFWGHWILIVIGLFSFSLFSSIFFFFLILFLSFAGCPSLEYELKMGELHKFSILLIFCKMRFFLSLSLFSPFSFSPKQR